MMSIENYKKKLESMSKEELLHEISNLISDHGIQLEQLKEEKKTLIWLNQGLEKQVDELTKELFTEKRSHSTMAIYEIELKKADKENAELQKQVDELTAFKTEAISISLYGKGRKDGEEVAVKDTAKEIEQELEGKGYFEYGQFTISGNDFIEIFKKRGVEVG